MSRKMTDNEIYRIIKNNIKDYKSGLELAKDFGIPLNRFYRMYNVYKKQNNIEDDEKELPKENNVKENKDVNQIFDDIKNLIVSGEAKSVHQACKQLGINDASLFQLLRKNGYNGIRDFYQRYVLGETKTIENKKNKNQNRRTSNSKYNYDKVISDVKNLITTGKAATVKEASRLLNLPPSSVKDIIIRKYSSLQNFYETLGIKKKHSNQKYDLDSVYKNLVDLFENKKVKSLHQARLLLGVSFETARKAIMEHGYKSLNDFYNQLSVSNNNIKEENSIIDELTNIIKEHGKITMEEASNLLGISDRTLRKKLSDHNTTYKDFVNSLIISDEKLTKEVVKEEIKKDKEVSKLKFERDMYKNKYLELLKTATPVDEIIDHIKNDIKRFDNIDLSLLEYNDNDEFNSEEELILMLSDTHIGEVVQLDNIIVNNESETINNYSIEIFKERMQKLYEGVIKLTDRLESKKKYTRFNIFMLGDMVSGIIHEELLRHKGLAITDQVVMGAEIIADFIYKLKRRFPTIDVYCVVGNHGRLDKKVSFKDKWNSFDYLLYKFIETKLENVNGINFYIPKQSMIIVKKFDFNFLLRHGDGKSNSFAGIPVYGIMRTSAKATQMFAGLHNTYIHYEILGHYHTPMALPKPAGKIIINGTLKGTDEYGLSSFLSSDVSQKLLVLNSKHGIFANIDIYCE